MKERRYMRQQYLVQIALFCWMTAMLVAAPSGIKQKLYILNSNSNDMTVVDVSTNQVIKTIEVGELPHGIAATKSQDLLYVSTEGDRGLTVVDAVTDEVIRRYNIFGLRPNEIDCTSDGRYVYVPALGDGVYEVFDSLREKIIARISVDGFPHNVVASPDDRYMYLSAYDRESRPGEIVVKGGKLTTLNKKIYVVDTTSHSVVATIPTKNTPRPIAISSDGNRLYVNVDYWLGFLVLDLSSQRVINQVAYDLTPEEKAIRSRSHGIGVTPDRREVWSTDVNHNLVHVFDVTKDSPQQIARLETGNTPLWLTMTPDGKTVYVANTIDDTISVFDVASKRERERIYLGERKSPVGKRKSPKRMLVLNVPNR